MIDYIRILKNMKNYLALEVRKIIYIYDKYIFTFKTDKL